MARDRPSPYGEGDCFFFRSAGACPPRSLHGEGHPLACACGIRGPSPYGEGDCFFYRSAGACPPRSLHGEGNPLACACGIRGPAPYVKGKRFFHRSRGLSLRRCAIYETPSISLHCATFAISPTAVLVSPAIPTCPTGRNGYPETHPASRRRSLSRCRPLT